VEGVEMGADVLKRGEVLRYQTDTGQSGDEYGIKLRAQRRKCRLTCVIAAPVSRTVLLVLRGSPGTSDSVPLSFVPVMDSMLTLFEMNCCNVSIHNSNCMMVLSNIVNLIRELRVD
jgi:hypothetical protein